MQSAGFFRMGVAGISKPLGFAVRCVTTPPRGPVGNRALELQVPRLPDMPAIQEPPARGNGLTRRKGMGFPGNLPDLRAPLSLPFRRSCRRSPRLGDIYDRLYNGTADDGRWAASPERCHRPAYSWRDAGNPARTLPAAGESVIGLSGFRYPDPRRT